jgi:hypothetical protein
MHTVSNQQACCRCCIAFPLPSLQLTLPTRSTNMSFIKLTNQHGIKAQTVYEVSLSFYQSISTMISREARGLATCDIWVKQGMQLPGAMAVQTAAALMRSRLNNRMQDAVSLDVPSTHDTPRTAAAAAVSAATAAAAADAVQPDSVAGVHCAPHAGLQAESAQEIRKGEL